jgi:hypothetical protein
VGLRPVDLRLVDLHLVGLRLVGLRLVGLLLVDRMVLPAVLRRYTFLVRAFPFLAVVSIQMGRELFYQYLLRLVGLGGPGLWHGIALCHRHLHDP